MEITQCPHCRTRVLIDADGICRAVVGWRDPSVIRGEFLVHPAPRFEAAQRKDSSRRTSDGLPVQSFQCLLTDLATLYKNEVSGDSCPDATFERLTVPTPLQRRECVLMGLPLGA